MSGFELPDPGELYLGDEEIDLNLYTDRISASWTARLSYRGFTRTCLELDGISQGSESLLETTEGSVEAPLGENIDDYSGDAVSITVYGSDYSLSWDRVDQGRVSDYGEVGIVLDRSSPRTLLDAFEETTGEDLSDEDVSHLLKLTNNVDS